ncbi:MAG: MBL fold metallo-hydrolase [Actinomycetia bacterium]|nr:MBL fold metallo-hydrolase [Actinomycetes bacterium]
MTTTKNDLADSDARQVTSILSDATSGTVEIRFLGTAAFEIVTANGVRLLIDPFLEENAESPIKVADLGQLDLLIVTHAAYDHLGDTLDIMKRWPDVMCIAGVDVRGYLMAQGIAGERIWSSPWGMKIAVAGVTVKPVYSRHWSYIQGPDGVPYSSIPMGYIVYASETCRIYHSGDTALFSDMKLIAEFDEPTVGLLNVGFPRNHLGAKHGVPDYLSGEMDAREAARAVEWLGIETAIPCHHDDVKLPEIVEFAARVVALDDVDGAILEPGQSHVATADAGWSLSDTWSAES